MTLEHQVIPLPMAQRLKELGVKQESYFSWFGDLAPRLMDNGKDPATVGPWLFLSTTKPCNNQEADWRIDVNQKTPLAAAFTVAELGQLLPDFLTLDHFRMHFHSYKQYQYKKPALWTCTFGRSTDKEVPDFDRHNEAEARGALLIHLLESNLITIEEVNSRI